MPDTPALIERLERLKTLHETQVIGAVQGYWQLLPDILATLRSDAATIAGLREKVRVLREAVKVFAEEADTAGSERRDHEPIWESPMAMNIWVGDLRRARDAYAATESEG